MIKEELTGKKFGRLTVLGYSHIKNRENYWKCVCECGTEKIISEHNIKNGHTRSCGCLKREAAVLNNTTHDMTNTRFYGIWNGIVQRCTNKNRDAYKKYSKLGICDRWLKFEKFKEDMYEEYLLHCKKFGEKDTSIDRKDNTKGYYKENCRWATCSEQALNRSSSTRYLINGEELTAKEIAEKYNLTYSTVMHRIHRNWDFEDLIKPMGYKRSREKWN